MPRRDSELDYPHRSWPENSQLGLVLASPGRAPRHCVLSAAWSMQAGFMRFAPSLDGAWGVVLNTGHSACIYPPRAAQGGSTCCDPMIPVLEVAMKLSRRQLIKLGLASGINSV